MNLRTSLVVVLALLAHRDAVADQGTVDVQVDPTPFFLRGFAPEVGVGTGAHRIYLTVVAYDVPKVLREDAAFAERRDYRLGLGYEHFFRARFAGPFVGASALWTHSTFSRADTDTAGTAGTKEAGTLAATARVGWVFYPISALPHLLFGPWISASWAFSPDELMIGDKRIERRSLGFIAAAQLGWRFDLGGAR
jgi:hypothetical protein